MNLREKSLEVRQIFAEVDAEIKSFMDTAHLGCVAGCGKCCANPEVSASVIEFLPLAFDLYERGKAEVALEKLETATADDFCVLYKSLSPSGDKGHCSDYANRGMICRLFGSSARRNKSGQKEMITCKIIKEQKSTLFEETAKAINEGLHIPVSSAAYSQLYNIDYQMTEKQLPVNQAIKNALEAVLTYTYYCENQEPEAAENF